MKFTRETLKSVNPYAVVKVEEMTGERLKVVTGHDSTYLTVKVKSKEQAESMHKISKVEKFACETVARPKYNHTKGLIYTYEFNIENLEELKVAFRRGTT